MISESFSCGPLTLEIKLIGLLSANLFGYTAILSAISPDILHNEMIVYQAWSIHKGTNSIIKSKNKKGTEHDEPITQ